MELNIKLQDLAAGNEMVTFDESTGIVKFKSDLLFASGSDVVSSQAIKSIQKLASIINSESAASFDIVVAGHTDDVPIKRASTKAKHPTNWHLSANRGIAVLNVLQSSKVNAKRLSVRGFGEFSPVGPNKPNKKGNAANRRVEIFIIPSGS
jgi:chemotaxis protein MotB